MDWRTGTFIFPTMRIIALQIIILALLYSNCHAATVDETVHGDLTVTDNLLVSGSQYTFSTIGTPSAISSNSVTTNSITSNSVIASRIFADDTLGCDNLVTANTVSANSIGWISTNSVLIGGAYYLPTYNPTSRMALWNDGQGNVSWNTAQVYGDGVGGGSSTSNRYNLNNLEGYSTTKVFETGGLYGGFITANTVTASTISGMTVRFGATQLPTNAPAHQQILQYDVPSSSLLWATITAGGDMTKAVYDADDDGKVTDLESEAYSLTELSDVTTAAESAGQILVYKDTPPPAGWENVTMSGDGSMAAGGALTVADDSHAHVIANIDSFTSAALYGQISDETGSAAGVPLAVFNVNPTLTGATLAGILADNDDMVFECDANSDGTNSYSFTDGASTEIANLSEAGVLQIDGDFTVSGGDITGTTDSTLTLWADTDIIFECDADGDGTESYKWRDGASTEIAELFETGNLQLDGDLFVDGGNIGISTDTDLVTMALNTFTVAGTVAATTVTQGGQTMYDANDVPGGELGGTWASPTIDDSVAVSSWNLTTPTFTTTAMLAGILQDNDNMVFECDANSDGTNSYSFTDGAATEIANLTEAGILQIDSDLRVDGGDIGLTTDTDLIQIAANAVTINGTLASTTINTGSGAMDLGDAAVANGDTNSVPTGDQVYDFCETTQAYLQAADLITTLLFGSGSDGDTSITSNTNLTRDMYYDDLSISNNATLDPSGYRIFVKGTLTIASGSKIAADGGNGGNGGNGGDAFDPATPGTAGTAGTAGTVADAGGSLPAPLAGKAGGAGGEGVSGVAPTGGNNGVAGNSGNAQTSALRGTNAGVAGGAGGNGGEGPPATGGAAGTAGSRTELAASYGDMRDAVRATSWAVINNAGTVAIPKGCSASGSGGGGASGSIAGGVSLAGDTLISTPNGYIKIKDLKKGNEVYSWDGKEIVKDIIVEIQTHIINKPIKHIIINEKLDVTFSHIIHTENRGWIKAEDIIVGDILLNDKPETKKVVSVKSYQSDENVYDLEIKDNHNFFADRILVHNIPAASGGGGGGGGSGANGGYLFIAAKTIANSGSITATGGNGGNGGNGGIGAGAAYEVGGSGGGGGGGGGDGGVIVIISNTSSASYGTITASGGSAGAKGVHSDGLNAGDPGVDGSAGTAGSTGLIIAITV